LAEWIRERCNAGDKAAVDAVMERSEVIEEPPGEVYVPAQKPIVKACPHHKQKGELCYRCDPRWGFPVIA
jgi:hypothetical protein